MLAFLIIAIFTVAGKYIFELFGITLPAFRITGGILVFQIGLNMLQGEQSKVQQPGDGASDKSRAAQLSVAVSPLAVPILAGPGTIATAMNFVAVRSFTHLAITIGAFGVMCVISYAFFVSGEKLIKYIGENAVNVVTKMMGRISRRALSLGSRCRERRAHRPFPATLMLSPLFPGGCNGSGERA